jgi:hypothetical protein
MDWVLYMYRIQTTDMIILVKRIREKKECLLYLLVFEMLIDRHVKSRIQLSCSLSLYLMVLRDFQCLPNVDFVPHSAALSH